MNNSLLLLLLFLPFILLGQNCHIEGKLLNQKGEAIPYASVYLPELGKSGMANENGEFTIIGPCDFQLIRFQSLGYQSKDIKIDFSAKVFHNITLKQVAYALQEVTIGPAKEDPAYNIIRKATVMSEYYKKQINAYQAKLYIRNYFDVNKMPWLVEKMASKEELAFIKSGDVQETVVEYSFKKPNIIREKIIASKSAKADSLLLGSNYINLNFYNLGGNEIINPLSRGAFHLYNFEYQHSFYQEEHKVHKIKIIPKRRGDDLMRGDIYINDGIWNINQVDVSFNQQMLDFEYNQLYQEIDKIVWMPVNHKIKAKVNFMGFDMDVQYLATLKEINVETDSVINQKIFETLNKKTTDSVDNVPVPQLSPQEDGFEKSKRQEKIEELIQKENLSNREALKLLRLVKKEHSEIEEDTTVNYQINSNHFVTKDDSVFAANDSLWESDRSIPLSETEKNIYANNDTLDFSKYTQTNFSDSSQSFFSKALFYNSRKYGKNKNTSWQLRGVLSGITPSFNTVDGWLLDKKIIDFRWENFHSRFLEITPTISYAFARDRWMGAVSFNSQYNKKYQARIYGSIGRRTADYNRQPNLEAWINSISSLVFSSNYKKLYEEDFVTIGHNIEPINGLKIEVSAEVSKRKMLDNHSSQKWFDFISKKYTSNIPPHPEGLFRQNIYNNNNFKLSTSVRYTPKQFYRNFIYDKRVVKSAYPTFGLDFEQGISGIFEGEGDYQFFSFSIRQKTSYRLIDEIAYKFEIGKFLSKKQLNFADYKSFNTAPFYFMNSTEDMGYKILDYYAFNSRKAYFEGHISIEDNHILLKYLPLLNRTNWTEKLHLSYLYTTDRSIHYSEVGYSLNRLFLFLNAGVYFGFENEKDNNFGIRIGLNISQMID